MTSQPRIDTSSRSRTDDGAIAVIVAILAVLLLGMAAFALDFGNAYSVKRQLSVAADSAALAAARAANASIPVGGNCSESALQAVARAAAVTANSQNDRSGQSSVTSVAVDCSGGTLTVTVANERSLETIFGSLFGADGYTVARQASAQLYVPGAASGLRPIGACQATLLANYQPAAGVANPFLVFVSKDQAVCGTTPAGNWGFTNFLDQGSFGTYNDPGDPAYNPEETCTSGNPSAGGQAGCQSLWTDIGYSGPVYFPNTLTSPGPGLAGNTGFSNSSAWRSALDGLVDDIILLPVADRFSGNGSNARLNVTGIVTLRVCSVNRGGTVRQGTSTDCAGRRVPTTNPDLATWQGLKNNEAALWAIPTDYVTSGVTNPRSDCRLGQSGCDFGTRAVRLYR